MPLFRRVLVSALALTVLTVLLIAGPALPPVAYAMNWLGCFLVEHGAYSAAVAIFEAPAGHGNADALNNLGVMRRKGWGVEKDNYEARSLFEAALSSGHHVQAAYNLAEMLPKRRELGVLKVGANAYQTGIDIKRDVVALLEANVARGDAHSAVLLADRLHHDSSEYVVADHQKRKLELLEMAAATGDVAYRYKYADELVEQARSLNVSPRGVTGDIRQRQVELLHAALLQLVAVHSAGDPRGADTIGFLSKHVLDEFPEAITTEVAAHDAFAWSKTSADMGFLPARCGVGIQLFREANRVQAVKPDPTVAAAIPYLSDCAAASDKKPPATKPFGKPSMYAVKLRGSQTSLVNSPGWANLYLGELYAAGRGVPRDVVKARQYISVAANDHKFNEAAKRLKELATASP